MKVQLKGQDEPVTLTEVIKDDQEAVIGVTGTGKRFVTLIDRVRNHLPSRHPYRVYLNGGAGFRAIDPSFEDAEEWLLHGEEGETFTLPDGREVVVSRDDVLSLLSATPEDEAATIANNN